MSKKQTLYGIMLTKEQLDFLKDDNQGFHRMKALDTFLSLASIEPFHYEKQGFSVDITVGQFVISIVELSALWHCDRKTAAKVVRLFNEVGMLSSEKNNRTSIHTILCLAAWYVDGVNEPVHNPHYKRPVRQSATDTSQVSNVPSDTCLSFGGPSFSNSVARKDGNAKSAIPVIPSDGSDCPLSIPSSSNKPEGSEQSADLGDAMNSASTVFISDNREMSSAEDGKMHCEHPDNPQAEGTTDGFHPNEPEPVYDDDGNVVGRIGPNPSPEGAPSSDSSLPLVESSSANPNPANEPQDDRL